MRVPGTGSEKSGAGGAVGAGGGGGRRHGPAVACVAASRRAGAGVTAGVTAAPRGAGAVTVGPGVGVRALALRASGRGGGLERCSGGDGEGCLLSGRAPSRGESGHSGGVQVPWGHPAVLPGTGGGGQKSSAVWVFCVRGLRWVGRVWWLRWHLVRVNTPSARTGRAAEARVTTKHTPRGGDTGATKPTERASSSGGTPRPLVRARPGCIGDHGKRHPEPWKQSVTSGTQSRKGLPAKQRGPATQATGVRRSYCGLAGAIPPVVTDTPNDWAAP